MAAKVLLVEDDFSVADSVMRAFSLRGIDATHAASVKAALDAYSPDLYDLMIVDFNLPDGTGLDFLAKIRGSDKAVTVISSGLDRSKEIAAAGLHVDHMIDKGKVGLLWDVIEEVVG